MRIVDSYKERRLSRKWQHWSEVDPLDDYTRWAGIGAMVAVALFVLVLALVVGFVVAR
jgi:hypothetical protein